MLRRSAVLARDALVEGMDNQMTQQAWNAICPDQSAMLTGSWKNEPSTA